MKGVVSAENLLNSVLSWINYDKKSRKKALDYISGCLELKECREQFLADTAKVHIDIFQSNPEFNRRVKHLLHPRKLTVVVIGGVYKRGENRWNNTNAWKLASETQFEEITEFSGDLFMRGPSICYYDWNKLILTGGFRTDFCVMLDNSTKKWKNIKTLRTQSRLHASVCILQQLFIFGGVKFRRAPQEWSTSVEYLNIEQEHEVWQSAPPMPSALGVPKISNLDTKVYLMGDNNPVLYLFDVIKKVWSQKTAMPQNPERGFSIAANNGNLYACWRTNDGMLEIHHFH